MRLYVTSLRIFTITFGEGTIPTTSRVEALAISNLRSTSKLLGRFYMTTRKNENDPEVEALRRRFEALLLGADLSGEEKRVLSQEILLIVYGNEGVAK